MAAYRMSLGHMTAVGVSIAAHAAVALGVALHQPPAVFQQDPPDIVTVSLVEAADLFAVPPPPLPAPGPAPTEPEAAKPAAPSPAKSAAAAPAVLAASPAMAAASEVPRPAPVAAPVPPAPRLAAAPPPAPPEDPLADYRRRVWAHLAANAPAAARGAGVAVAQFGLDEDGAILFVRLSRSSGDPLFDRACLKAIRAAAPLPRPPAGTRREDLVFEAPIKAPAGR